MAYIQDIYIKYKMIPLSSAFTKNAIEISSSGCELLRTLQSHLKQTETQTQTEKKTGHATGLDPQSRDATIPQGGRAGGRLQRCIGASTSSADPPLSAESCSPV